MSHVAQWWLAVIRELGKLPRQQYPNLPIAEAAKLKIAEAMDLAKAKGAVPPEGEW